MSSTSFEKCIQLFKPAKGREALLVKKMFVLLVAVETQDVIIGVTSVDTQTDHRKRMWHTYRKCVHV